MAKRYIKRKSAVKPITGSIVDTTNIDDKSKNTYSAGVIDDKISKAGGVEVGAVFGWTGEGIPEGYDEVKKGYSTEEMLTGETWKDGKPIYRKVVDLGVVGDTNNVTSYTIGTDIDLLIETKATLEKTGSSQLIPAENGENFARIHSYSKNSLIYIELKRDSVLSWGDRNLVVTVEYTKTTDTGNFKYIEKKSVTPIEPITGSIVDGTNIDDKTTNAYSANVIDGLVKEVYSTEETVIGTYLGKPLYKRTYTKFTLSTGTNIEYYIFETDTNKVMKKAEGVLWLNENDTTNYFTSVVGSGSVDFGASEFSSNYQNGNMYVSRAVNNNFITKGLEVTAYYTKTTD